MDHELLEECTTAYNISNKKQGTFAFSDLSNQKTEVPCLEGEIQVSNEKSYIRILIQRTQALTVFITNSKIDLLAKMGLEKANRFLTDNFISGKVI